jgi:5'-methylthioadenosine phosphorylase
MAYATAGLVADCDCWLDDPTQQLSVAAIFERDGQTLATARRVPEELLRAPLPAALLTPQSALGEQQRQWLGLLRA